MYKAIEIIPKYQKEELNMTSSSAEDDNIDVFNTHIGMVDLLQKDCKRKIDGSKHDNLYVDCRFIELICLLWFFLFPFLTKIVALLLLVHVS